MKHKGSGWLWMAAVAVVAAGCSQAPRRAAAGKPAEATPAAEKMPAVAVIRTAFGEIEIDLFVDQAPATVKNFADYAKRGHFDGTIFHRVMDGFMIQGGGFMPDMREKPTRAPIPNEATNRLGNLRGTVAMARTPDPHSASSQFYINVVDNPMLDHRAPTFDGFGYCVFGRVSRGMDVVDRIKTVPTTSVGGHQNVPVQPVLIEKVEVR
jgi:peptidyl-prolyl cis-trans isomerase B (cyclophilin B)